MENKKFLFFFSFLFFNIEALNARNFETSLQKASQGNLRQSTASAPIFNLAKMSEEISNVQELRSQLVNEDDEKHILKHSMLEFTKELGSGQVQQKNHRKFCLLFCILTISFS